MFTISNRLCLAISKPLCYCLTLCSVSVAFAFFFLCFYTLCAKKGQFWSWTCNLKLTSQGSQTLDYSYQLTAISGLSWNAWITWTVPFYGKNLAAMTAGNTVLYTKGVTLVLEAEVRQSCIYIVCLKRSVREIWYMSFPFSCHLGISTASLIITYTVKPFIFILTLLLCPNSLPAAFVTQPINVFSIIIKSHFCCHSLSRLCIAHHFLSNSIYSTSTEAHKHHHPSCHISFWRSIII